MFQPGKSGNPNGRPKGTKSKMTEEIRQQFANLLEAKMPEFDQWMTRIAEADPAKAMEIMIKISERFVPALSRTEVTGEDGGPVNFTFKFGQRAETETEE